MPHRLNLDKLLSLRTCQQEYQIGDSYDCWAKVAVAITGEYFVADTGLVATGAGNMNPKAIELFNEIIAKIGRESWFEIMKLNDSGEWQDALIKAVHLLCLTGIAELE